MNDKRPARSLLSLALIGSLGAALGWSGDSYACPAEPYYSAVCIMALVGPQKAGFGNTYVPADGRQLAITSNQALYSLLGSTYGGNNTTYFNLPDLRGRVVLGAGTYTDTSGTINYAIGAKGGQAALTLTAAQVPLSPHTHTLGTGVTVTTTAGSLAATVGLGSLTATTSLTGVTASADGSALTLNGTSGGTLSNSPAGATLGTPGTTQKIYSDATPSVTMSTGSIKGTAPVTFTGSPVTTLTGSPTVALSGSPAVTVGGQTDSASAGVSSPVPTMPPYLALTYFIAVNGSSYPIPND